MDLGGLHVADLYLGDPDLGDMDFCALNLPTADLGSRL